MGFEPTHLPHGGRPGAPTKAIHVGETDRLRLEDKKTSFCNDDPAKIGNQTHSTKPGTEMLCTVISGPPLFNCTTSPT